MLEYYESAKHLNISSNQGIGIYGWQACANMIRKVYIIWYISFEKIYMVISFKYYLYYFIDYRV